ncbi:MAG: hypothetical protein ACYC1F_05425 [Gallionellaceae bacterium]
MMLAKKAVAKMVANKPVAKKATAKKPTAKKPTAKKVATSKPAAKKPPLKIPDGYGKSDGGILIRSDANNKDVVPPSKLRAGIIAAQAEIRKSLDDIVSVMAQDFEIYEIELTASFSADGKFLGFGVGGAATITIRIRPNECEGN